MSVSVVWTHHTPPGCYHVLLGTLAMTRSLGDEKYKQKPLPPEEQMVIADPELISLQIEPEYEFLVLATDGNMFSILLN